MNLSSTKILFMAGGIAASLLFSACSDTEVAGGVTDIDNSVSGIVVNQKGFAISNARIIAYYDSWDQTQVSDSAAAVHSDSIGNFILEADTSRNIILYAENEGECVLAQVTQTENNKLVLGSHKSLESSIDGATSGYVRIVGTNERAPIGPDGSFRFESIPPGDITLTYIREDKPEGYLDFRTTDEREDIFLPPMEHNPDGDRFHHPENGEDMYGVDFDMGWDRPYHGPDDRPPEDKRKTDPDESEPVFH